MFEDSEMSDYLFAQPSFLEGVARNLDILGTLEVYNTSRSAEEADIRAQKEDVATLQDDMRIAASKVLYFYGN